METFQPHCFLSKWSQHFTITGKRICLHPNPLLSALVNNRLLSIETFQRHAFFPYAVNSSGLQVRGFVYIPIHFCLLLSTINYLSIETFQWHCFLSMWSSQFSITGKRICLHPNPFLSTLVNNRLLIDWNVLATLLSFHGVNSSWLQVREFVYNILLFCTSNQAQLSSNVHIVF